MMNTKQRILDEEKLQDFVGDFNKHFEDLTKWYKRDAEKIKNIRESFWRKYPKIFKDSSGDGVEMETTMETESRPIVHREEELRKVEERLLSKRTNERFTNYDAVMSDDSLSLSQKIILLQEAIEDATRRKIHYASLQGELFQKCFLQSNKVYKETLEETKFSERWVLFYENYTNLLWNTIKSYTVLFFKLHSL